MGAAARRQSLAKTRKSGFCHFFDTQNPRRKIAPGIAFSLRSGNGVQIQVLD